MRTAACIVTLLASEARAWAGTDGNNCKFPSVDWILWDHGAGISATQKVGTMGTSAFYGGYSAGARRRPSIPARARPPAQRARSP